MKEKQSLKKVENVISVTVGSNIITLNGEEKHLDIIIWDNKVTYKDIKDHIV